MFVKKLVWKMYDYFGPIRIYFHNFPNNTNCKIDIHNAINSVIEVYNELCAIVQVRYYILRVFRFDSD